MRAGIANRERRAYALGTVDAGIGISVDVGIGIAEVAGIGMVDGGGIAGSGMASAGVVAGAAMASSASLSESRWQAVRAATRARDRISGVFIGFSSVAAGAGAPYAHTMSRRRECRQRAIPRP
jgi:hypothetical protein